MSDKTTDAPRAMTRLALYYSDDSIGILRANQTEEDAFKEADDADFGPIEPHERTRVFRVAITEIEQLARPEIAQPRASHRFPDEASQ